MAKVLIHIHTGPGDRNKATLGFIVAVSALRQGHQTDIFLAGDGVHLLAPAVIPTLEGEGTGRLTDHLSAIRSLGGQLHVSRLSSQARGYDEMLLSGWPASFASPDVLIRLSLSADTVLCY